MAAAERRQPPLAEREQQAHRGAAHARPEHEADKGDAVGDGDAGERVAQPVEDAGEEEQRDREPEARRPRGPAPGAAEANGGEIARRPGLLKGQEMRTGRPPAPSRRQAASSLPARTFCHRLIAGAIAMRNMPATSTNTVT